MADAEDSKSSVRKHVRVQVPLSAPLKNKGLWRRARNGIRVNAMLTARDSRNKFLKHDAEGMNFVISISEQRSIICPDLGPASSWEDESFPLLHEALKQFYGRCNSIFRTNLLSDT